MFILFIWSISTFLGGGDGAWGVSIDEVEAGQSCLERPVGARRYLNPLLDFPPQRQDGYSISPLFRSAQNILPPFSSNWNDFCFPTELSTFRRTLWPSFRQRHSWKSTLVALHCNETLGMRRQNAFAASLACEAWRFLSNLNALRRRRSRDNKHESRLTATPLQRPNATVLEKFDCIRVRL